MKQHMEFQHRNQDSRESLAEQIMAQFERQAAAERGLEREQADRQGHLRDAA